LYIFSLLVPVVVEMAAENLMEALVLPGHIVEQVGHIVVATAPRQLEEILFQIHVQLGLLPEEQGLGS
jgi:hypothetical protein